jgi:predicted ATPase/transcriptional regulator with XRE-family HTH domain
MVINLDVSFGSWISHRRKALELTQAQLAHLAGCSLSAIRKIESDERRPSTQVANLLGQHLKIPTPERDLFLKVARGEVSTVRLPDALYALDGLAATTSSMVSPPAEREVMSNLPMPSTALVGREFELGELTHLLTDPACRLLTLFGPGGMGKTRLAEEVARALRGRFPSGVYFVPLTQVSEAQYIAPAIACALGVKFHGTDGLETQLVNSLRHKQALIVLDNCEHLLDGMHLATDILSRATGVKLLVTSRERLNLPGEWVFELNGLPVPLNDQVGHVENYSAVALFVQAARHAHTGFTLTQDDKPHVVRICHLVGGLPLAIELAATWVRVLTCAEIADELARGLDFLSTPRRDTPDRHHSIRAAFDQSWNLLTAQERAALSTLSAFQGGFRRDSAEQVSGADLRLLTSLVDKSLLRRVDGRYDMHELIWQYARSHLEASSVALNEALERHSRFYLGWLADMDQPLKDARQAESVQAIAVEIENVRTACRWAGAHLQAAEAASATSAALDGSLPALFWFFEMTSRYQEAINLFEQMVRDLEPDGAPVAAAPAVEMETVALGHALACLGYFLFRSGQFNRARPELERSLSLLGPLAGSPSRASRTALSDAYFYAGSMLYLMGDYERGRQMLRDCLDMKRALGDTWSMGGIYFHLGNSALLMGQYGEAQHDFDESLALVRGLNDLVARLRVSSTLSAVLYKQGSYERARQLAQETVTLCKTAGDRWSKAQALKIVGLASLAQNPSNRDGSRDESRRCFDESLEIMRDLGDLFHLAQLLCEVGRFEMEAGESDNARCYFLESLSTAREANLPHLAPDSLLGLAELYKGAGQARPALELVTLALRHTSGPDVRGRAESLRDALAAELGEQQAGEATARGAVADLAGVMDKILIEASCDEVSSPLPMIEFT